MIICGGSIFLDTGHLDSIVHPRQKTVCVSKGVLTGTLPLFLAAHGVFIPVRYCSDVG
ncbi:uncharacterized protein GLRG_06232 [Colletotrichum graminicola M1.001]|uniref:Uncharacterized protein n=1 Tax=Colletotrichum graminicola (strain M1.001 / M2 / FGSC 10212) TaxID=645133 RepID=E3QJQ0_COLGM|nr:uncharacterized protein GLRG_06232 [Colletotrichum graminicola M1.001]EFQ31088.1 hypothetical protein GLRG_06232 [Colletotrichum graminicola M1.001]